MKIKNDWSKHELIIIKTENCLIHWLKKPDTICGNVKFINIDGILVVKGDYGNWVFCREFHPSPNEEVCQYYWCEKLSIHSTQVYKNYNSKDTEEAIKERLQEPDDELHKGEREFLEESLNYVDDELDYTSFIYRQKPSNLDYENLIIRKHLDTHLEVVFDAFNEICRRLASNRTKQGYLI